MERSCPESIFLRCFCERCPAIAERRKFIERSSAIELHGSRFSSAAGATCYAGPDTGYEQRFKFAVEFDFEQCR